MPRLEDVLLPIIISSCEVFSGCSRPSVRPTAVASPNAVAFPENAAALPRYHSKRLAVSVPLPDGHAWNIDDHTQPELVATHPPTHSKVIIAVFRATELVGRVQCEALTRARNLVPTGDLRTLEDGSATIYQTFDTRVWVAVRPGGGPEQSLVGYVLAFGGFLRKCFAFIFSTQVDSASDEPVLSSRLAFARARILGGLELDSFGAIPRDTPAGPGFAQPH
jgi:hypothetical protein